MTLIAGGEISAKTRESLLKQLNDQITVPTMPAVQTASLKIPQNPFEEGFQRGNFPGPGGGQQNNQQQQRQQAANSNAAAIDNPVVKIAGLLLGSPEFQRQ